MLMGLLILHQVPAALGVIGIVAVVIAGIGAARSGDRRAAHVAADLARVVSLETCPTDSSTTRSPARPTCAAVGLTNLPVLGDVVGRGLVEIRYTGRRSGRSFAVTW